MVCHARPAAPRCAIPARHAVGIALLSIVMTSAGLAIAASGLPAAPSWTAAPCDCPPITPDTTLARTFGVYPWQLPSLSDAEAMHRAAAPEPHPIVQRIAIARSLLWERVLRYRVVCADGRAEIPRVAGVWRVGHVVHGASGLTLDVVHWDDVDDGHATLYFAAGTTRLCGVGE